MTPLETLVHQFVQTLPHDAILSHGDRRIVMESGDLERRLREALCPGGLLLSSDASLSSPPRQPL